MAKTDQENAMVPISDKEDTSIQVPAAQEERPKSSSVGRVVKRVLIFFLRLILFLVILAALAAGAYFGLPILYEKYVRPVENHTAQLTKLEDRQKTSETQIAELQTRLSTLEAAQPNQAESITDIESRLVVVEASITAHTQALESLNEMQANLLADNEATRTEMENQIGLLKSLELLSRARLFLYQSNYGLARQDVQIARDLLVELQLDATEFKTLEVAEVVFRLDLVLKNLPAFPVAASDDLDIAWQVLMQGIPQAPEETVTPEPATETPDATPEPPVEVVPTETP